jgi:hypothetical protein
MSTQKTKRDNLPPLQKRIILYLAMHEPQTINETVKGIRSRQYRSSYKSSWTAFNSLEKKGAIKKTDVKTYRGREYPRFWLSSAGVFVALVEGASAQDLLEKTIKAYPNDKVLQCCLELAPFTGIEGYRVALSAILSKGKFEQSDATTMMLTQMEKDLSIKQFKQFLEVLKRYPEEYEKMKKQVEQFNKSLDKIKEMI